MTNLELYNKVRSVPAEALKQIAGGRLKGMTDINPMWRIKTLTEQFGACGFGWKTQIVRTWLDAGANGEISANVEIVLHVKQNGEWSDGISGIGGSMLVAKESSGLRTDDECYKKAYTDALSVACKALGIGADVYFARDKSTKYDPIDNASNNAPQKPKGEVKYTPALSDSGQPLMTVEQGKELVKLGSDLQKVAEYYKTSVDQLTQLQAQQAIDLKKSRSINGGQHG